jgi:hypothetical protein
VNDEAVLSKRVKHFNRFTGKSDMAELLLRSIVVVVVVVADAPRQPSTLFDKPEDPLSPRRRRTWTVPSRFPFRG